MVCVIVRTEFHGRIFRVHELQMAKHLENNSRKSPYESKSHTEFFATYFIDKVIVCPVFVELALQLLLTATFECILYLIVKKFHFRIKVELGSSYTFQTRVAGITFSLTVSML